MHPQAVGCLDISIPVPVMEQCTKIEEGHKMKLFGTCTKKDARKRNKDHDNDEQVTILAQKEDTSLIISLHAASMGGVLQRKLSGFWKCHIKSTCLYTDSTSEQHQEKQDRGEISSNNMMSPSRRSPDESIAVKCDPETMATTSTNVTSSEIMTMTDRSASAGTTILSKVTTVKTEPGDPEEGGLLNDGLKLVSEDGLYLPSACTLNNVKRTEEYGLSHTVTTKTEDVSDTSSVEKYESKPKAKRTKYSKRKAKNRENKKSEGIQQIFSCIECDKHYPSEAMLKRHWKKRGQSAEHCPVCNKQFDCPVALSNHVPTHVVDTSSLTCKTCDKRFSKKQILHQHSRIHTGERPFRCDICDKGFISGTQLVFHRRKHTGDSPYMCTTCGKRYARNGHLKIHMAVHANERRFECSKCGKRFNTAAILRHHVQVHAEKSRICDICGAAFRKGSHLTEHMKTHSTEPRPHCCATCGKRFLRIGNLKVHMLQHTGERPFACNLCDKRFKQNVLLKRHLKVDHGHPENVSSGGDETTGT